MILDSSSLPVVSLLYGQDESSVRIFSHNINETSKGNSNMKMIIDDSEIEEILISDGRIEDKTEDKGKVIIKGEFQGKREEGKDNLVKEITAIDALTIGVTKAAEINGTTHSSASKYADGKDISDEDTRARVLSRKFNIADTAVAKLMETLDLFDPTAMDKQTDIIKAAGQLAGIVERVSEKNRAEGNQVHLHLYGPKQKSINSYEVVEVGGN
jgi:hypothetical protein